MIADDPQFERNPAFAREPHRRRHPRIGHRHHHVRRNGTLPRELDADPLARLVHPAPVEHAVRTREIDILEHAEPSRLRAERLDAPHPRIVDDHDLARIDVAHELRVHDVERARLARQHPRAGAASRLARRADPPQDQRPHPQRIAHPDQRVRRQRHQRVGAHHLLERVDQPVRHRRIEADRDQVDEHLAVGARLEQTPPPDQRPAQRQRVGEVPVVRDREPAELEIRIQRLHVAVHRVAGGRVAIMSDRRMAGQRGDDPCVPVIVAHQPQPLVLMEPLAVERHDPGRLLAAVLQRMQPERRDRRRVRSPPDPEDAAFLVRMIVVRRAHVTHQSLSPIRSHRRPASASRHPAPARAVAPMMAPGPSPTRRPHRRAASPAPA